MVCAVSEKRHSILQEDSRSGSSEDELAPCVNNGVSKRAAQCLGERQHSSRKRSCPADLRFGSYSPSGRDAFDQTEPDFRAYSTDDIAPFTSLSRVTADSVASDGIVRTVNGVSVRLQEEELWNAFRALQTEMIINRGGRRMFPHIIVAIEGLESDETYSVAMEIAVADDRRYKYVNGKWMAMGIADPGPVRQVYVHPDSPKPGIVWTKSLVSFTKVRLTNNKESKESILLHSMHKYMVSLTITKESNLSSGGSMMRFDFPETTFIAVTAYQNSAITRLKIQNNPFAKAFRDVTTSSKRGDNRVATHENRNTCHADCAPKLSSKGQLNLPDILKLQNNLKASQQSRYEFTFPSPLEFGCYGRPPSLFYPTDIPWVNNLGIGYSVPVIHPMWYPDRRCCSATTSQVLENQSQILNSEDESENQALHGGMSPASASVKQDGDGRKKYNQP